MFVYKFFYKFCFVTIVSREYSIFFYSNFILTKKNKNIVFFNYIRKKQATFAQ